MKPTSELLEKSRFPMKVYSADGGFRTLAIKSCNPSKERRLRAFSGLFGPSLDQTPT